MTERQLKFSIVFVCGVIAGVCGTLVVFLMIG